MTWTKEMIAAGGNSASVRNSFHLGGANYKNEKTLRPLCPLHKITDQHRRRGGKSLSCLRHEQSHPGLDSTSGTRRLLPSTRRPRTAPAFTSLWRHFFTTKPSLAALAYYAETPWNGQGNGNPASFYCTQLGGSDSFGGVSAAGGGWVELDTIDVVLEACIFPDNPPSISWGLFTIPTALFAASISPPF